MNTNKKVLEDMLFYYLHSLIKEGEPDPLQKIATELPEMINCSKEQIDYVKMNILEGNKLVENLDSSIGLLSSMEESKTLDLESIKIVSSILKIMKKDAMESIEKVWLGYEAN